jgi:hypothetical protein
VRHDVRRDPGAQIGQRVGAFGQPLGPAVGGGDARVELGVEQHEHVFRIPKHAGLGPPPAQLGERQSGLEHDAHRGILRSLARLVEHRAGLEAGRQHAAVGGVVGDERLQFCDGVVTPRGDPCGAVVG